VPLLLLIYKTWNWILAIVVALIAAIVFRHGYEEIAADLARIPHPRVTDVVRPESGEKIPASERLRFSAPFAFCERGYSF
jgi:hypothetical protein